MSQLAMLTWHDAKAGDQFLEGLLIDDRLKRREIWKKIGEH